MKILRYLIPFLLISGISAQSLQPMPKAVQKKTDGSNAVTEDLTIPFGRTLSVSGTLNVPSTVHFTGSLAVLGTIANSAPSAGFMQYSDTGTLLYTPLGTAVNYDASAFDPAGAAAAVTLSGLGAVPSTRTINGYPLNANVTLGTSDFGLGPTNRPSFQGAYLGGASADTTRSLIVNGNIRASDQGNPVAATPQIGGSQTSINRIMFHAENVTPFTPSVSTDAQLTGFYAVPIEAATATTFNSRLNGLTVSPQYVSSDVGARLNSFGVVSSALRDNVNDTSTYAANGLTAITTAVGHFPTVLGSIVTGTATGLQDTINNYGGTITTATGIGVFSNVGTSTGPANPVIGTYYAARFHAPIFANGGSITNDHGVFSEDTVATNWFAGPTGFGTTRAPVYAVDIGGDLNFTGNLRKSGVIQSFVPQSLTINGYDLSANRSLTYTDIGADAAGAAAAVTLAGLNGVPTTTTVNGHALSGNVTVTNADLGAVPTSTTVNGHALSSNVTVTYTDVGADVAGAAAAVTLAGLSGVPTSRTVNGHALTGNVTVTTGDLGLGTAATHASTDFDAAGAAAAVTLSGLSGVPTSRTVNGHALTGNVTVTNADLGAVPTSTTVNGHALSGNVTVTTGDLGLGTAATAAKSGAGGTVASVSGATVVGHLATFADTVGTVQDSGTSSVGVVSIYGRTGAVVATSGDYSYSQITGLGTAATATKSGAGSTVASVSGTVVTGHLAAFADTQGSIMDAGTAGGGGGGVVSIYGRTGAVIATSGDYSAAQITGLGTAATHASTDFDAAGAAAAVTVTSISAVPTSRTVNGYDLTANRSLTYTDVGADVAGAAAAVTATSISAVPTSRTVNGHALTGNVTVTNADLGAVPTSTTVNGHALSSNVTVTYGDVGADAAGAAAAVTATSISAVPTSRTVNGHALTGNVTVTYGDVGADAAGAAAAVTATSISAVPTSRTVNGHALTGNVTVTNADLGATPTSTTVNGHALSSNVTVTNADLGAVPTSRTVNGHALTGNVTVTATDVNLGSVSNNLQLAAANNLSDLTSVSSAWTALGLGTAAGYAYGAFDPAGAAAAVTAASLSAVPTSRTVNGYALSSNVTLTKTDLSLGNVLNSPQLVTTSNLSDLTSASSARTNLGLGSVQNTALSTWPGSTNVTTLGTLPVINVSATDPALGVLDNVFDYDYSPTTVYQGGSVYVDWVNGSGSPLQNGTALKVQSVVETTAPSVGAPGGLAAGVILKRGGLDAFGLLGMINWYPGISAEGPAIWAITRGPNTVGYNADLFRASSEGLGNYKVTGADNHGGLIRIHCASTTGITTGDAIGISDVVGTTEANNVGATNAVWTISNLTSTTFDLVGSTFTHTYVSGGNITHALNPGHGFEVYSTYGAANAPVKGFYVGNALTYGVLIGNETGAPSTSNGFTIPTLPYALVLNDNTTPFYVDSGGAVMSAQYLGRNAGSTPVPILTAKSNSEMASGTVLQSAGGGIDFSNAAGTTLGYITDAGAWVRPGSSVTTANALGALAINTAKGLNTKTISTGSTFTFSGAPATDTWFNLLVTNSSGSAIAVSIPSSTSMTLGSTITSFTLGASSKAFLTWHYDGSAYQLFGEPEPTVIPAHTPSSSSEAGVQGQMTQDATYLYVWTGASTVKRITLSSF